MFCSISIAAFEKKNPDTLVTQSQKLMFFLNSPPLKLCNQFYSEICFPHSNNISSS